MSISERMDKHTELTRYISAAEAEADKSAFTFRAEILKLRDHKYLPSMARLVRIMEAQGVEFSRYSSLRSFADYIENFKTPDRLASIRDEKKRELDELEEEKKPFQEIINSLKPRLTIINQFNAASFPDHMKYMISPSTKLAVQKKLAPHIFSGNKRKRLLNFYKGYQEKFGKDADPFADLETLQNAEKDLNDVVERTSGAKNQLTPQYYRVSSAAGAFGDHIKSERLADLRGDIAHAVKMPLALQAIIDDPAIPLEFKHAAGYYALQQSRRGALAALGDYGDILLREENVHERKNYPELDAKAEAETSSQREKITGYVDRDKQIMARVGEYLERIAEMRALDAEISAETSSVLTSYSQINDQRRGRVIEGLKNDFGPF